MIIILLAYWMTTTVYGVYWLIKHPASKFASDPPDEYVTLLEVMGKLFPAALLAWLFVPLFLMSRIRFKRSRL
jgi:heme/copper-type cytochrome/quinol oxidase subunit 2